MITKNNPCVKEIGLLNAQFRCDLNSECAFDSPCFFMLGPENIFANIEFFKMMLQTRMGNRITY